LSSQETLKRKSPGLFRPSLSPVPFTVRFLSRLACYVYFRFFPRRKGAPMPSKGPVIVVMNHQSYLDPILAEVSCPRMLRFLARSTLFRNRLFGGFISILGAVPIDREGSGLGGLKKAVELLEGGSAILIFPESTRSKDGTIADFKAGFVWLARRTGATILPIAVSGACRAWPRSNRLPRPYKIRATVLDPIRPEELAPREGETERDAEQRAVREIRDMIIAAKAGMEAPKK